MSGKTDGSSIGVHNAGLPEYSVSPDVQAICDKLDFLGRFVVAAILAATETSVQHSAQSYAKEADKLFAEMKK